MPEKYFAIFETAIRTELEEVTKSLSFITPESIQKTVDILMNCKGKLILTGAGKSGLIAQKMAATFSSTGTPSFFLHPGDAMHGDLGAVRKGDAVLAIAKSGESEEFVGMLRVVTEMQVPVISILGNANSSAGRMSTVIIHAPVSREADPLDLAPTASTTLALAIGDALALTLARLRNFQPEHFALYHPGGQLGKRLLLKVKDFLITGRGVPTIHTDSSLIDFLKQEDAPNLGGVMVVDDNEKLLGIITDGDIRRAIVKHGNILESSIPQIMTSNPVSIHKDTLAIDALKLMENRTSQISVLPVVDEENRPVGLLRLHDLIQAGL